MLIELLRKKYPKANLVAATAMWMQSGPVERFQLGKWVKEKDAEEFRFEAPEPLGNQTDQGFAMILEVLNGARVIIARQGEVHFDNDESGLERTKIRDSIALKVDTSGKTSKVSNLSNESSSRDILLAVLGEKKLYIEPQNYSESNRKFIVGVDIVKQAMGAKGSNSR